MSADPLLARLDRVKRTGPGRWIARCPAHDDRGPSLSVRELPDGRVLVHCFAGCSAHEIVSAAGLELHDLFPATTADGRKPERNPFSAADALRCLIYEAAIVRQFAVAFVSDSPLSGADYARMALAVERIDAARGSVWTT